MRIFLILLGRYLKRKIYDKGYICYYKYCHKVKGSDEIHIETPRFNDEVHVEIVPDVMIKNKWHPPPANVCNDCKETLTIFNTSEHNICTSCNIKRLKIIENKKEKRYQEFLMYKLKQEKEAKMLRKRQQLLELGIDVGNDGDDSEKSKND